MVDALRALIDHLHCKDKLFDIAGHPAFLITSDEKTSQHPTPYPTPWVWYAPTFIGTLPDPSHTWLFSQFLAKGMAVAGVDVGESWGNIEDCGVYSFFYKILHFNHGLSKRPCLLPQSRGGLIMYNWAADNPRKVSCIAGIYPMCDLRSFPQSDIYTVFHMSEMELKSFLINNNPVDRLAPLAEADIPIFHVHGDMDDRVPLRQNSLELARRYRRLAGTMEVRIIHGRGHEVIPDFFKCRKLVDFIIRHAE